MDRLTVRESSGYDLVKMNGTFCDTYCESQPVQTCRDCAINEAIQKLAYYEDLEERCGIIIGATIEDSICSYEKLEKKLKEMNK